MNTPEYILKRDCRYFTGEKPCRFHKSEGEVCRDCKHYSPARDRILIIKLGAMGDVVRTTFILPGLKDKYPGCHMTWITAEGSGELLRGIDMIDCLLELSPASVAYISAVKFDIVFSLDPSLEGGAIAQNAESPVKKGFGVDPAGKLYPFDQASEEWYLTGIFDALKKNNVKTYQEMVKDITGIHNRKDEIFLNLSEQETMAGRSFLVENNIPDDKPVIGINTGAGGRWKRKRWTRKGCLELIRMIESKTDASILLFGGPLESDRNRWLIEHSPEGVFDTGTDNGPGQFLGLLNACDIVVSGDTFAMHAAVALKKKVVALFGPTSASEIELYGRGIKVISPMECACCYREDCGKDPNCMDMLSPESVYEAVRKLLK